MEAEQLTEAEALVVWCGVVWPHCDRYGAQFVKEYIDASTPSELNVGEFWTDLKWNGSNLNYNQDEARQRLCNWINSNGKSCAAFDFPTKVRAHHIAHAPPPPRCARPPACPEEAPGLSQCGCWAGQGANAAGAHAVTQCGCRAS